MGNLGRHSRITTTVSPFGGTIQPAPHQLLLPLLFLAERPIEEGRCRRAGACGCGPEGCAGSSARNSAQEKSDRYPSGGSWRWPLAITCTTAGPLPPYPLSGTGCRGCARFRCPCIHVQAVVRSSPGPAPSGSVSITEIAPLVNQVSYRHPAPAVIARTIGVLHLRAPGNATRRSERCRRRPGCHPQAHRRRAPPPSYARPSSRPTPSPRQAYLNQS